MNKFNKDELQDLIDDKHNDITNLSSEIANLINELFFKQEKLNNEKTQLEIYLGIMNKLDEKDDHVS